LAQEAASVLPPLCASPKKGRMLFVLICICESAQATADQLTRLYGMGIGVAGTGLSGCGSAIGLSVDITQRESVRAMLNSILWAYGGIDNIIVTAGVFIARI
jgi:NAD(P)-dependent dehydrogenase (short-subunit alcohol dehydrogenase family)